ncbi:hypothetical protein HYC85_028312 [Camellia sinensis]|uniref:Uncharacterized protein n=1 Tax=Camellia sinensis TaxID=4442 RepID=A0A7J7FW03_CAMSI|nr:hypothetical protein HYC85_028312 [Camellia sinensis]
MSQFDNIRSKHIFKEVFKLTMKVRIMNRASVHAIQVDANMKYAKLNVIPLN